VGARGEQVESRGGGWHVLCRGHGRFLFGGEGANSSMAGVAPESGAIAGLEDAGSVRVCLKGLSALTCLFLHHLSAAAVDVRIINDAVSKRPRGRSDVVLRRFRVRHWWPPQAGNPALCLTGAVRDRGGVCRTTSLTHGVREGGPDTSGRKRQEATQIAVCYLMGIANKASPPPPPPPPP